MSQLCLVHFVGHEHYEASKAHDSDEYQKEVPHPMDLTASHGVVNRRVRATQDQNIDAAVVQLGKRFEPVLALHEEQVEDG